MSRGELDRLIRRLEDRTDGFERMIGTRLDRSRRFDDSRREDRINEQVDDLENALDRLRRNFDRDDRRHENLEEVRDVMQEARDVNRLVGRTRLPSGAERHWAVLRDDLNRLARAYGTSGV